ncbi:WxL domain-containing protein [Lactococcus lactis subsp. lactis]|uniref:WxL domain-containing protein n=1 Tax=Lactococcus lactis TaxID=1358 RepID=UPI000760967C|nr:WxL domain-containing protein [Lactococcus lactis]KWT47849.1 hypothetical protein ABB41_07980 [Lactococcus lactis]MDR7696994.1 WxL domain-containing protein [Lactococcus lactis]
MKKIITLSSAALTALSLVAIAAPAFADTGAVTTPGSSTTAQQWTSNTGVTFNAPDPETPLPPITVPTEPPVVVTPQPGALALDYATDFDFGVNQIDGKTTDFKALTETDPSKSNSQASPLVAFHDLDGVSTNYTISATASGLSGLNSSTITLGAATFSNISGADATDTSSLADVSTSHVLTNQPQVLVTSTGAVSGYYADKFSDATLTVPVADQAAGNHTGTITWDLIVAP